MKVASFKKMVVTLGLVSLAGFTRVDAQEEIGSRLELNYNPETAIMNIIVRLDERVNRCRFKIRAGISYAGDTSFTAVRRIVSRTIRGTKRVQFRLTNLTGVQNNEDGLPPILSMQSTAICNNREISSTSTAAARFVNCGVGQQDVTPGRFLRNLERALRTAQPL
jgi:hypothetical protein